MLDNPQKPQKRKFTILILVSRIDQTYTRTLVTVTAYSDYEASMKAQEWFMRINPNREYVDHILFIDLGNLQSIDIDKEGE